MELLRSGADPTVIALRGADRRVRRCGRQRLGAARVAALPVVGADRVGVLAAGDGALLLDLVADVFDYISIPWLDMRAIFEEVGRACRA